MSKIRTIAGWVLAAILACLFISSSFAKITSSAEAVENVATYGLSAGIFKWLGAIEALSLLLFLIPRTGLPGTMLLTAYLGGAIATHLEHHLSILFPAITEGMVWVTATIRFPEISERLQKTGIKKN